ncbi:PEP-CTERM sorting domain-containing protein [Teredinibacter haidensis]|uniref:PEP-CTERM sorting domain-containing protein n=1 Tax=Teredinibacter haidensis TaxID=2731755 RepID=UPI003CCD4220
MAICISDPAFARSCNSRSDCPADVTRADGSRTEYFCSVNKTCAWITAGVPTVSIPEPSSLSLMIAGLAGVYLQSRKKAKRK